MSATSTARSMTEADIQRGITDKLKWLGYRVYHTWLAKNSTPGFPDIIAVDGCGHLVVIECKGRHGRVSSEQIIWLDGFSCVPGCVMVNIVGPTDTENWISYDTALERLDALHGAMTTAARDAHREAAV